MCPVACGHIQAQPCEECVCGNSRPRKSFSCGSNPENRFARSPGFAQAVYHVQVSEIYLLARRITRGIFGITRGCFGGASQSKKRRGQRVETFAPVLRLRKVSYKPLEEGDGLFIAAHLKVRTPDAIERSRDVHIVRIAFDQRSKAFARLS